MPDFRRFVETSCFECVIDVAAWTSPDGECNGASVDVGLMSFHGRMEWRSWRGRLRRALRAVRAEEYPWLEFSDGPELDAFIDALGAAGTIAFPRHETE